VKDAIYFDSMSLMDSRLNKTFPSKFQMSNIQSIAVPLEWFETVKLLAKMFGDEDNKGILVSHLKELILLQEQGDGVPPTSSSEPDREAIKEQVLDCLRTNSKLVVLPSIKIMTTDEFPCLSR
jgi:hypothetical protein